MVHRLSAGKYELLSGNPVWLPEIGLGIGKEVGTYHGIKREWLYWYDEQGHRYPTPEEITQREYQARLEAEQRVRRLAAQLAALGIDPNTI